MVEADVPSAFTGPLPVILELVATAAPAVKFTLPPDTLTGVLRLNVLVSAVVDFSVQVEIPLESELEQAVVVFPDPLAEKVGTVPMTGFECASWRVIVMVEVETPSAVIGPMPVMVEVLEEAAPATNPTVPPLKLIGVVMESVFTSACVDESVQVELPVALVLPQAEMILLDPDAPTVGVTPEIGLLFAS